MGAPLLRKVDCIRLAVDDLDAAIAFYQSLGHELIWRRPTAAGLRLPESDAEQAAERFVSAGGTHVSGPHEIEIGRCIVVNDPWGNTLTLLDMSRGPLPETKALD